MVDRIDRPGTYSRAVDSYRLFEILFGFGATARLYEAN